MMEFSSSMISAENKKGKLTCLLHHPTRKYSILLHDVKDNELIFRDCVHYFFRQTLSVSIAGH
jgi:hypothetical protein